MIKSEKEWKKKLTPEQFKVMREKATEKPFTGKLLKNKKKGTYSCAGCENEIFDSKTKFDSGTGWPSFADVKNNDRVRLKADFSEGAPRIEVICSKCGSHLGHVFSDGPTSTGKRYCINSCALKFKNEK